MFSFYENTMSGVKINFCNAAYPTATTFELQNYIAIIINGLLF